MKVKKIHIENYRMLKRIDIDLEENLSLIIGKNNCGKTSFLSILNKFIGSQSSTNNFTYNDFNSDFQDSLFDAINDDQLSWEKLNIKGIELYLFIEYDETDNLSNIQPLMLDLDPDNNIVILKFEYTISEQKFIKLISDFNAYCKKFEKEPDYSKSEVFDIFMRVKHRKYFEMLKKAILFELVIQNKKLFPSLKCKEQLDEKDADGHFIYDSYDLANNCIGSKASFALDILLNSINDGKHTFSNWKMPPYIEEGLLWLRQN